MSNKLKSKKLTPSDTIGIVSPSSSISDFPRRTKRGKKALQDLGFNVKFSDNTLNNATPKEKAQDIMKMFTDDSIDAIICSTGGWTANTVLKHLNYDEIEKNPKIFCGFSDITALNLAIKRKTGLITFNGPTLLPSFGEYAGPHEYTVKWFERSLMSEKAIETIQAPEEYTDEILYWDEEDDRRREMQTASPTQFFGKTSVQGSLIGGNLITMNILIGTPFEPSFTDNILLVEEEQGSVETYQRRLTYLEHVGVFDEINGMIVSRPTGISADGKKDIKDILKDISHKHSFPVAAWVDSGHTDPMIPLPVGATTRLDADKEAIIIEESGVF